MRKLANELLFPDPGTLPEAYDQVVREAITAFNDLGDYVWKAPDLIGLHREIEEEKLQGFGPDAVSQRIKEFRRSTEFRKLDDVFPNLMANGHLFLGCSMLEVYLYRVATLLEQESKIRLASVQGDGIVRIWRYMRQNAIDPSQQALWPQIEAALSLRNCLLHASGILPWSRYEAAVRNIVRGATYLMRAHRAYSDKTGMVSIVETELGPRLRITNEYPWILAAYFRGFTVSFCSQIVAERSR